VPPFAYAILAAGWIIWMMPFFIRRRKTGRIEKVDRRARWGLLLEAAAYSLVWQSAFWLRSPGPGRIFLSVVFLILAIVLSWTSVRALGRQWRVDAGLNTDHELVRSGAYRVVRHPIYTSMLGMLVGTGLMVTSLPVLALSITLFIAGTEIRVRLEDKLLASRFGEEFLSYQRAVSAYIPFIKLRF
jgi:protein-S-isoprenylcysteine O-methyltransferase Ste14